MLAVYIGLAATWNLPPSFRRSSAKFLLTFEFDLGGKHYTFERRYACDVRKSSWFQMDILTGRPPVFRFKISDNEVLYLFRPTHPTGWHCDANVRAVYTADDPEPPAAVLVTRAHDDEISLARYETVVAAPSGVLEENSFDFSSVKLTVDPMPSWYIWKFIKRQDFIENIWVRQAPGFGPKPTAENIVEMALFESMRVWVIPRDIWAKHGIKLDDLPSGGEAVQIKLDDLDHLRPAKIAKIAWNNIPHPEWSNPDHPESRLFEMKGFSSMTLNPATGTWKQEASVTNVSRYFDKKVTCNRIGRDHTKIPKNRCSGILLRTEGFARIRISDQVIQVRESDLRSRKGVWVYDPRTENIQIISQQFNSIPTPFEEIFED